MGNKKGPACAGPLIITINESNLPAVATAAAATAATVAAEAAATTTAAWTSAAATSAGLVLGFVDAQLTTTHIVAIQALNGTGCIGLAHFNEPESAGAAGLTIGRQRHGLDSPVLREQCANVRLAGAERQIAYIDFGHKFSHSPNNSKQPVGRVKRLTALATSHGRNTSQVRESVSHEPKEP